MHFGAHVSIAKSLALAPQRAADLGCEIFQIFSRSPRGGNPPALTKEVIAAFASACLKFQQYDCYIHAPYFINFASAASRIRYGSIAVVRQELERGSRLGVKAMMTHLGSGKDYSLPKAVNKAAESIAKSLSGYKGKTKLLLELSAGSGQILGGSFENMAEIIEQAEKILKKKDIIGVCLDTAHIFASGYDIRDKKSVAKTINEFDKIIGLKRLGVIHVNDSLVDFNARVDRHSHLGKGKIGLAGFEALVKHPKLKEIDMIVETPTEAGMKRDIAFLKKIRN